MTHSLLITTASAPSTTTQPTTQQTGNSSMNMADWLLVEVPLINALCVGTIIAALIGVLGKHWSETRLDKQRQSYNDKLDEVRRKHEKEMQYLKDKYEDNRQRRVEKFRLIDDWRRILEDDSIIMSELYRKYNSTLKKHFSDEANRRILKAIGRNTEHLFQLQFSIIEEGFGFKKERERLHRLNCVREDLVKALNQELTDLEIEMKRY